jgi:hypothetical protein
LGNPLPSHFEKMLAPSELLQSSAPAAQDSGLSLLRKLEGEDLEITGFVAARNATTAADYRAYLGVGHQGELGSLAKIRSRAFYGAGTYDGASAEGTALPEDVHATTALVGNWVGADWKLESARIARNTFVAGVEYRQQLEFEMLDLNRLVAKPTAAPEDATSAARNVSMVAHNTVALSQDVSLKLGVRRNGDTTESGHVRNYELTYDKALWQRNTVRLSAYRQDAQGLLAAAAQPSGVTQAMPGRTGTSGYELRMERKGFSGARARVSYAWQETTNWLAGSNSGSLGQHLTKLALDVPVLPKWLSTSVELQHLDIVGSASGERERGFLIGNLTLANAMVSSATRVSLGMHNLFGAKAIDSSASLMSFIPPDGRSVRLDVTRKL